jgi:hypothetical protein
MNWFALQRQQWIKETIEIFGFINREHLELKFGISTPKASKDLQEYQKLYPKTIIYNKTSKRYEKGPH